MQGAHRRSGRNSARSFFLLPLVLALLALAAFPVFAHAGGIPEYEVENETELPESQTTVKPKSHGGQHHPSQNNAPAKASEAETENSSEPKSESSEETESNQAATGGNHSGNGGNKPGGEGGSKAQQSKSGDGIGGAEKVATNTSGKPASSSSGSSPIVPILIAVAVLAAISIGVVLYRQRKGDSGPGSDRRVSSPNAS